jgi:3-isopropylmalate/(R)-2-methylmalate dehydratase large subunit
MGHTKSEVYLANPAIAAASAILGRVGGPEEIGVQAEDVDAFMAALA